jgi:hypothetical protein
MVSSYHLSIGQALSGERIGLQRFGDRAQVYYCATRIRELDFVNQRSILVNRWLTDEVPLTQNCKACVGTGHPKNGCESGAPL